MERKTDKEVFRQLKPTNFVQVRNVQDTNKIVRRGGTENKK